MNEVTLINFYCIWNSTYIKSSTNSKHLTLSVNENTCSHFSCYLYPCHYHRCDAAFYSFCVHTYYIFEHFRASQLYILVTTWMCFPTTSRAALCSRVRLAVNTSRSCVCVCVCVSACPVGLRCRRVPPFAIHSCVASNRVSGAAGESSHRPSAAQ